MSRSIPRRLSIKNAIKPSPEEMNFATLMFHIAGSNAFRFAQVTGAKNPLPAKVEGLTKDTAKPAAIEWQRRALALFRGLGRRDREARVLNRLGDLSRKTGAMSDAERYFAEAQKLARNILQDLSRGSA